MLEAEETAENVNEFEVAYCQYAIADISEKRSAYRHQHQARGYEEAAALFYQAVHDYELALDRGEAGEAEDERVRDRYDLVVHQADLVWMEYNRFVRQAMRCLRRAEEFARVIGIRNDQ